MNWHLLWKATLLTTLIGYAILVIIVFIGGLKNVVDMFRDLREDTPQE